ncbi:hypothetical protein BP6252_05464 [Coleophoma cylindrospora]|uniref:RRM domain-containing protein n=1 Tax=Coleophoma cylindrospora TaxID=1849047 RepID=A0A3D8RUD7_9HELO|nr:hypothetical protein BP6252_05464 [Coleophoma cylindrospora]
MGPPKKEAGLSRAERKSKKRKAEDAIPDLPGGEDNGDADEQDTIDIKSEPSKKRKRSGEETESVAESPFKERKSAKREKKAKKDKKGDAEATAEPIDVESAPVESADASEEATTAKKSKKERKAERRAKELAEGGKKEEEKTFEATGESADVAVDAAPTDGKAVTAKADGEQAPKKKNNRNRDKKRKAKAEAAEGEQKAARFIVFIGNLPFSATTESIAKHFASVKPTVRHRTQKEDPKKSKGFAFLEFDGYDHMKTCLKLFHHSTFDDGISPARKINVELTAGGGGNTKDRKAKIQGKNEKLNEQRVRRIQEEEKAKYAKTAAATAVDGIHPSRRAIVPGA